MNDQEVLYEFKIFLKLGKSDVLERIAAALRITGPFLDSLI